MGKKKEEINSWNPVLAKAKGVIQTRGRTAPMAKRKKQILSFEGEHRLYLP